MTVTESDDLVLELERRLNAPPQRVFDAWIEPEQVSQWFGPGEMTIVHTDIDPRVGGKWQMTMRSPSGDDRTVQGVYREIDRPRRLAFTWAWSHEGSVGFETEVILDFRADGDGTLMRLTQRTFPDQKQRDMHAMGWNASLPGLARLVEG